MYETLPVDIENQKIIEQNVYSLREKIGPNQCYRVWSPLFSQTFVCKVVKGEFSFHQEIHNFMQFEHPNILRIVNYFNEGNKFFIISEDCVHGNVKEYLDQTNISTTERIEFCTDLIRGLNYLHSKGITRNHLKLENILVDKSCKVKIADYGLPYFIDESDEKFGGPKYFLAPEVLQKLNVNTFKADVWALGIILYYVAYKELPFGDEELWNDFTQYGLARIPHFISEEFMRTLKLALQVNPEKRPTPQELFKVMNNQTHIPDPTAMARKRRISRMNRSSASFKSNVLNPTFGTSQLSLTKSTFVSRSNPML